MRLIAFLYLVHFLRHGMVFPYIPLYAKDLGATASDIGLIISLFAMLSVFLSLPVGQLCEKMSTKLMLVFGVSGNIAYSLMLFITQDLWFLCLTQVVGGVSFLFLILSSQTYISKLQDTRVREKGFGGMSFTAAGGQTLGPFLGGYLSSCFDIQTVFLWAFFLSFLGLSVFGLKEKKPQQSNIRGFFQDQPLQKVGNLLADRGFVAILLFGFVVLFAVSLRSSFLPLLIKEKGFSEETIGFLFSIFAFAMTGIRVFMGKAFAFFSRKTFLIVSLAAVLIGIGGVVQVGNIFGLVTLFLVFGLGFGISQPLSMVMTADVSSYDTAGLAMGMRFTTIALATFSSPLILGWVVSCFGLNWAFFFAAGLVLLGGGLITWLFWNEVVLK